MGFVGQTLKFLVGLFFQVYFFFFGRPAYSGEIQSILALYDDSPDKFTSLFQTIRLWDMPFEEIAELVPKKGFIVDLGSGDGLLANYLGILENKRKVLGIELNIKRIKEAHKGIKNVSFQNADILDVDLPKADCFLLIHVLHHLSQRKLQEKMLKIISTKLEKGGLLVVAEIIEKPLWKFIFTWLTDIFTVPVIFERKLIDTKIKYRSEKGWTKTLKQNGYIIKKIVHPHQGKPFSHIVFSCQKV